MNALPRRASVSPRSPRSPRRARDPLFAIAIAIVSACALATVASAARADVRREPSPTGPLVLAEKTQLRVTEAFLSFDCHASGADAACDFEARYVVSNPSVAREEIVGAFLTEEAHGVTVTVDGKAIEPAPAPAPEPAADVAAPASAPSPSPPPPSPPPPPPPPPPQGTLGVPLRAEPASRHEIVVRGTLPVGHVRFPAGFGSDAVFARHALFAREPAADTYVIRYVLLPLRRWAGDPSIHVRVRHPEAWRLAGEGWAQAREQGDVVETRATPLSKAGDAIELSMTRERPAYANGGVLFGLGSARGDFVGFRARFGYEIAVPRPLLWSVVLDTNLSSTTFLTPTATLASGAVWQIPSFGVGVGLPVQLAPVRRVGARLQLDVMFYAVGIVTAIDFFPQSQGPALRQYTVLGQLAL